MTSHRRRKKLLRGDGRIISVYGDRDGERVARPGRTVDPA